MSETKPAKRGKAQLAVSGLKEEYDRDQLLETARFSLTLMTKKWFEGHFDDTMQDAIGKLLLSIYILSRDGYLMTKKQAMSNLKAVDARTLHRYLQAAVDKEFLEVRQSIEDRRVSFLIPTQKLLDHIAFRLTEVANRIQIVPDMFLLAPGASRMPHPTRHDYVQRVYELFTAKQLFPPPNKELFREDAIRLLEHNPTPYRNVALSLREDGQLLESIEVYKKAFERDDKYYLAYEECSEAYVRAKQYDNAIKLMSRCIGIYPRYFKAYVARAAAFSAAGQFDSAIDDLQEAVSMAPDGFQHAALDPLFEAYVARAVVHETSGSLNEAIDDLRAASRISKKPHVTKRLRNLESQVHQKPISPPKK